MWEQGGYDDQSQHDQEREAPDFVYQRHHVVDASRADGVAHQAVGRGGQCIYRNQHNDVDASHDVGNSEFALSQPLHCHKENKPGGHRQEILKHGEARYTENAHQQNRVERPQAVEAILFQVDGDVRINQEKEQRSRFGDYGSNGCSFDAHFRKPEVSEYQGIVQHHIGQRHNHCIDGEHLGAGDSDVECPEHHVDK